MALPAAFRSRSLPLRLDIELSRGVTFLLDRQILQRTTEAATNQTITTPVDLTGVTSWSAIITGAYEGTELVAVVVTVVDAANGRIRISVDDGETDNLTDPGGSDSTAVIGKIDVMAKDATDVRLIFTGDVTLRRVTKVRTVWP